MLKLGVKVRTWDCLPHAKFCKKNYTKKFEIFETLSYISRHFIPIMLKFERTWETLFLNDTKVRHNRSRDTARGLPVLHCLGGDAY